MELKREMKVELTIDFREEMENQRKDIIITTNTYTKRLNSNLQEVIKKERAEFSKIISMTFPCNEKDPALLALPPPPNNLPNM